MTVGNDYELIDSVILMTFCVFSRSIECDNVYCTKYCAGASSRRGEWSSSDLVFNREEFYCPYVIYFTLRKCIVVQ